MTTLYRQIRCKMCGVGLEHKAHGRGRVFCGPACRVAWNRASRRWAAASVDAALAGLPEPARAFGYPVEIGIFDVSECGRVTKRARPGAAQGVNNERS